MHRGKVGMQYSLMEKEVDLFGSTSACVYEGKEHTKDPGEITGIFCEEREMRN